MRNIINSLESADDVPVKSDGAINEIADEEDDKYSAATQIFEVKKYVYPSENVLWSFIIFQRLPLNPPVYVSFELRFPATNTCILKLTFTFQRLR